MIKAPGTLSSKVADRIPCTAGILPASEKRERQAGRLRYIKFLLSLPFDLRKVIS